MNKKIILLISLLMTQTINASPISQFATVEYEHRKYTNDRGSNNLSSLSYGAKFKKATVVAKLTNSMRDVREDTDVGTEGKLDFYYNWNKNIFTKTGVSISDQNSNFLHQEFRQDISFKPRKDLILTVGGKHTEYADNIKVNSFSTGFSYYYLDKAIFSYKYSHFTSKNKNSSNGNTISIKVKDGDGSANTQLWLGFGTGAYSYEWDEDRYKVDTDFKSVTLRREQPLTNQWILGVAASKNWYQSPIDKYSSLNAKLDLTYKW